MAASLFGAGVWLLVEEAFFAIGLYARALTIAVSLIVFAGYWLWVDLVAPAIGIKIEK